MSVPTDVPLSQLSGLLVDEDGNGIPDLTIAPGVTYISDTIPPEVSISFSTSTQSLGISGVDDSGLPVRISSTTTYPIKKPKQKEYKGIATTTVGLSDQAGNATVLEYTESLPTQERRTAISLKSISYNGTVFALSTTTLKYKWATTTENQYRMFATHIKTASTTLESHYRPKQGKTIVMTKPQEIDDLDNDDDSDTRPTKEKINGMIVPSLRTVNGMVKIVY